MSSVDESIDNSSDADASSTRDCTGKKEELVHQIAKLFQSFYWKSDENNNDTQWSNGLKSFANSISESELEPSNLQNTPDHQTHQPGFEALMPTSSEKPCTNPVLDTSLSLIDNPSLNCETQLSVQNSVPPSLDHQVSDCCPLVDKLSKTSSAVRSPICETLPSIQNSITLYAGDQDSDSYEVIENLFQTNDDYITNDLTVETPSVQDLLSPSLNHRISEIDSLIDSRSNDASANFQFSVKDLVSTSTPKLVSDPSFLSTSKITSTRQTQFGKLKVLPNSLLKNIWKDMSVLRKEEPQNKTRGPGNKPSFVCPVPGCAQVCTKAGPFKVHVDWHSATKNLTFPHHVKGFTRKLRLGLPRKSHMNPKSKTFLGLDCKSESDNRTRNSSDETQYICHISGCGRVFNRLENLNQHLKYHSDQKDFFCAYCNKGFALKAQLCLHIKSHMNPKSSIFLKPEGDNEIRSSYDEKPYVCYIDDCGKDFSNAYCLKVHLRECHSDKENKDDVVTELQEYLQIKNDLPKYACHIPGCGKVFKTLGHLNRHLREYNYEKNFFRAHSDKSSLEGHFRRHTNLNRKNLQNDSDKEHSVSTYSVENFTCKDNAEKDTIQMKPNDGNVHCETQPDVKISMPSTNVLDSSLSCKDIVQNSMPSLLDSEDLQCYPITKNTENFEVSADCMTSISSFGPNQLNSQIIQSPPLCQTISQFSNCHVEDDNETRNLNNKKLYFCHIPDCKKVFSHIKRLNRHLDMHNRKANFFSAQYNKIFQNRDALEEHVKICTDHKIEKLENNVVSVSPSLFTPLIEKPIQCNWKMCQCPHCNALVGDNTRDCKLPLCGAEFHKKNDFQRHYQNHTAENISCPYCGESFGDCGSFDYHIYWKHKDLKIKRKLSEFFSIPKSSKKPRINEY